MNRSLRILALVTSIGLIGAVLYGNPVSAFQHDHAAEKPPEKPAAKGEYVCPMDGYKSDKPGKCPKCGMELVPKKAAEKTTYICPMDGYKSDKPGRCPKCGMNLVPEKPAKQKASSEHAGHDMSKMSPAQAQSGGGQHSGHQAAPPLPPAGDHSQHQAAKPAAPGERKILYWYDPMHPQYKSDKPGTAPDCGMDLVPKYADEQPAANMPAGTVMVPADKQQLIGVRTAVVQRERLRRQIRTTGQVITDESRIAHVHVKVPGYIEQVYVDYVGQAVKKGQPLFTLYSPDLLSTQQEYLIARRGANTLGGAPFKEVSDGANSLLNAARERLKLWDISDEQIKKLDETGQAQRAMIFYSPITGVVLERKAFPHTAVNPDTELYTVADLSTIWVTADIYEYEVPYVREGQRAQMQLSYYPGKTWNGVVKFIYPTADPMTRTVKARLEFPNPNLALKPQMFADVQLNVDYGTQVLVPQEAVLNSGREQYVFVAREGNHFEPRPVTIGAQIEGKVAVLSGLKPGETVVSSGNFLIDSESRLKSAMGGMKH
jgi:multidrug efflux pump subunit AcrA (membrane-fusion protein)